MKGRGNIIFFSGGFVLTIIYILLFNPIADSGDGPTYFRYAHLIAENRDTGAFISCSPLYPWILSVLISAFGEEVSIDTMIILQYILLFISIVLLYKMLIILFEREFIRLIAALAVMLNLSGIYYGFMLQTETVTLFFLILTLWVLHNGVIRNSLVHIFLSGISLSAMVLVRFNTLPLVFVLIVTIFFLEYSIKKIRLINVFRDLVIFVLPIVVILNGFAFLNYQKHDFYGLFPLGGSELVSRNALLATIDGTEKVSENNRQVLKIFNKAADQINISYPTEKKGSLIKLDRYNIADKLYKGFPVYSAALPELCSYFNINPEVPEPDLSSKLAPFFSEIRKLNRDKIWNIRILSLLSSFRSSSGLVIPEKPETNLGKLPFWIIAGYKLLFFVFSFMVFAASILYLVASLIKLIKPHQTLMMFILIVFGFFFINFAFATVGDANRYKYPAEPLIIVSGIYYIYTANAYIKRKIQSI